MYNMRMKVVERKISAALLRAMEQFPAVVLTDPRLAPFSLAEDARVSPFAGGYPEAFFGGCL